MWCLETPLSDFFYYVYTFYYSFMYIKLRHSACVIFKVLGHRFTLLCWQCRSFVKCFNWHVACRGYFFFFGLILLACHQTSTFLVIFIHRKLAVVIMFQCSEWTTDLIFCRHLGVMHRSVKHTFWALLDMKLIRVFHAKLSRGRSDSMQFLTFLSSLANCCCYCCRYVYSVSSKCRPCIVVKRADVLVCRQVLVLVCCYCRSLC